MSQITRGVLDAVVRHDRRRVLGLSAMAGAGIAVLALPRASAAASPGGDVGPSGEGGDLTAIVRVTYCDTGQFDLSVTIPTVDVKDGSYRVSLDGNIDGPWTEMTFSSVTFDDTIFFYFIGGGGGCDDPRLVQLRATPSCRIGRFESGTLVETSGLIQVDITV
jgi:hypothetical protein